MAFVRQFIGPSSSNSWIRALIIFMLAWAFLVYVFVTKMGIQTPTNDQDETVKRINQVLKLLEHSKQRNEELREMIDEFLR